MIPFVMRAVLVQAVAASPSVPAQVVPYGVGESFEYVARYGVFGDVGSAQMTVVGMDTVRGAQAWHFLLTVKAGAVGFKTDSRLESWTSTSDFISRRFIHLVNDNGTQRANDDFRIHPDSGFFRNTLHDTLSHPTVALPLDDLAFIYYLRTFQFKKDSTYQLSRYFRKEHNPVVITVLGHENITMPDGSRRSCWVLHPVVDEPGGLFNKNADAKIWITDDGLRMPVQIRSGAGVPIGAVTLKIRKITPPR